MIKNLILLLRILFSNSTKKTNEKTFVVVLKSEESFLNAKFSDNPFLEKINPDHILYCVCIKVVDYMETVKIIFCYSFLQILYRNF